MTTAARLADPDLFVAPPPAVDLREGDCLDVMPQLAAAGVRVGAIVTDPPYGIGFMGRAWDHGVPGTAFWRAAFDMLPPGGHLAAFGGTRTWHRLAAAIEDAGFELRDTVAWLYGSGFPKAGNALKPAFEPIILARKPLAGTVAANVAAHGAGGLNIDACRVAGGRWPANVVHDGSDEVEVAFAAFGERESRGGSRKVCADIGYHGGGAGAATPNYGADTGTASRFFYCAKASKADRAGSKHPTVKPIALVRWLIRLVTPPGGIVLDPFAGSGTTGAAAIAEGFPSLLIELDPQHAADIRRRFAP